MPRPLDACARPRMTACGRGRTRHAACAEGFLEARSWRRCIAIRSDGTCCTACCAGCSESATCCRSRWTTTWPSSAAEPRCSATCTRCTRSCASGRWRSAYARRAARAFIAWYRPDHRILQLAAPFFAERFAVMRWTILTPDASVTGIRRRSALSSGRACRASTRRAEDELEDLWRTYYASIFNPARLNPEAMRSEMPVRYWKNLPEVDAAAAADAAARKGGWRTW